MRRVSPFRPRLDADWVLVLVLFAAAAALRVWGVANALPYVQHADEPKVVDAAVHMVKTGDLNPHWFLYPSLLMYLQAGLTQLNLLWGLGRGFYSGPQSLPDGNHLLALAPDLYVWGRTASALIGAAAVAGTYALGRAVWGRAAGLGA